MAFLRGLETGCCALLLLLTGVLLLLLELLTKVRTGVN